MTSYQFKKEIHSIGLMFFLILGIGITTNITAQAQCQNYDYRQNGYSKPHYTAQRHDPYDRNDQNHHGDSRYDDYSQIARDNGYRSGVEHGAEHRNQGHKYSYEDAEHYRDGTAGYRREYGSKDAYKRAFREGFRRGYEEGYRGRNNSDHHR